MKYEKQDVLKSIVSGILTYSPLANAVMTAISSYASEKRNRPVNLFIEEMLLRMDTLEQSMSEHYLKSDEFCALATKSINKVVMDTRKQKVKLFSRIICLAQHCNLIFMRIINSL